MKPYPLYNQLHLVDIAEDVSKRWKKHQTFQSSIAQNKERPLFFYEGPPGTNGPPGIHHLFARTLKDLFGRYKTMQGYQVLRKAGWDTHGLPVELSVEKELHITKEQIGQKISLAAYNKACRATVLRYQKEWENLTRRIGYWVDLDNPYITCHPSYIERLWGLLERLYHKQLLYQDYTIQPYSPAAGSGLSSHELNQPGCYRDVKDTSIVAQFQVKHLHNTYLLAWTTTPWTLPANTALAIAPHITYVEIATYNRYTLQPIQVILAQDALPRYFHPHPKNKPLLPPSQKSDPIPWQITRYYQAADLVGWSYHQLLPYISPQEGKAFQVVAADFVTTTDGTGIVHIAPTFGADDFALAKKEGLASIFANQKEPQKLPIVDQQGRFVQAISDFSHQYVKAAYAPHHIRQEPDYQPVDLQIAIKLKKENKAFLVAPYSHSYPHCWRTGKPIIYYPLKAWFIKTTAYKKRLMALNKTINWQPTATGQGRFGQWLDNLVDWNLSRSRFWGTPLPIWRTQDGKEEKCIGSLSHLHAEVNKAIRAGFMSQPLPTHFDPHRPYIDEVILVSPQGQKMYREPDVIDVWFDSGSMPYAQNTPREKTASTPPTHFPAHFIIEGLDQTRGWFFTLHVLAVLLYDRVAFNNVLATGLVLDKQGNKMSKQLGNTIDPNTLLDEYGPDVIRWYFVTHSNPWDNIKFDPNTLQEVKRKFFSTLHHTYQFFALYARLDHFRSPTNPLPPASLPLLDRWMLSRLQHLIELTQKSYDAYAPTQAARAIQTFVIDDLSNWYVRLNRKRFWRHGMDRHKESGYETLKRCLITISQLAAPIAPFYMEQLYQDLQVNDQYQSVHLSRFPTPLAHDKNPLLERHMEYARKIVSLAHSIRKQYGIKVRIPLAQLLIPNTKELSPAAMQELIPIILQETNVKKVAFVSHTQGLVQQKVKPHLYRLGKKYGVHLQLIQKALANLSQEEIQKFKTSHSHLLKLPQAEIPLTLQDVLITTQDISGWAVATNEPITIALDRQLTPQLIAEGYARELVNKIQNARKAKSYAVNDKINLHISTPSQALESAIQTHLHYIMEETQTLHLSKKIDPPNAISFHIEEHPITLSFTQAKSNP